MAIFNKKKKKNAFYANDLQKTLHENLRFSATEQYKLLRTNLAFTLSRHVKCPVIGVTSSVKGEGKTTTALNLSYVLAESDKRVLLIDGDCRMPSVAMKMCLDGSHGLTDLLMGDEFDENRYRSDLRENWFILPAGKLPPNPSELLGSTAMEAVLNELKDKFDYIVLDLPPVNIVSDALAVSKFLTGMVVVLREDYTERRELANCVRQLELANVYVLGFIINESKSENAYGKYRIKKYDNYYNYYSKTGSKDEEGDGEADKKENKEEASNVAQDKEKSDA